MRDILKDIVKHTHGLGIIQAAKVTTDDGQTAIDAMDDDRTVVLRGTLHDQVKEFEGKFGLGRMAVLNGYLSYDFNDAEVDVSVIRGDYQGQDMPLELDFSAADGFSGSYRVINAALVDSQIKTASFKGAKWDIEVMPTQKAVKDLKYFAGVLGQYDPLFTVKTDGDDLKFYIGDQSTDKVELTFAKNVHGSLSHAWSFPLSTVLTILGLGDTSTMCMKISDQGAMMIQVDSGLGQYEYILPAKTGS